MWAELPTLRRACEAPLWAQVRETLAGRGLATPPLAQLPLERPAGGHSHLQDVPCGHYRLCSRPFCHTLPHPSYQVLMSSLPHHPWTTATGPWRRPSPSSLSSGSSQNSNMRHPFPFHGQERSFPEKPLPSAHVWDS